MAVTVPISDLQSAGPLTGAELTVLVQGGMTVQSNLADDSDYAISQVDSAFIISALGFTPYDDANPDDFISDISGLISAGSNITITGAGTALSPYVINSSGGGGGASLPVDEIAFGTGVGIGSTSKFYRNSAVGTGEGQTIFGNSLTTSILNYRTDAESMVVIARDTNPALSTNAHGFVDATVFNRASSGNAYNSFGANVDYVGASLFDHYVPYQAVFVLRSGSSMSTYYNGYDSVTVQSGSNIVNRYGLYIADGNGAGTIGTQTALYVPTLSKGTNNWAIDIVSNDVRTFGNIFIASAGSSTNDLTKEFSFYHASTTKTDFIRSRLNANSTQLEFYASSSALSADRRVLQLDGSDGSNANSRPSKARLSGILNLENTVNVAPENNDLWIEGGVLKVRLGGVTTNLA